MVVSSIISGCGKDSVPVSADSGAPSASTKIDPALVGSWYHVGHSDGYTFSGDGWWMTLSVIQNRLQVDYDGDMGYLTTPRPGLCMLSWKDSTGNTTTVSYRYELSSGGSLLTITNPAVQGPDSQRLYTRKGIADQIPW
jgi:hypothetical protein